MTEDNDISRLARITSIVTMLKSKRILTATAIAEKFNISVRTVYRDIRELEQSGVPIITIDGKGYSLMDGYTFPPLMFSEAEANALITAEYLIREAKDSSLNKHFEEALTKIKSVFRYNIKEKSELLSDRLFILKNGSGHKTSNSLSDLQLAITSKILTKIEYQKPNDETTSIRTIEPVAIYYSNENWILIAWCRLRDDYRAFRIDRMKKIEFHTATFKDRKFDLREFFASCPDNIFFNP